MSDASVHSALRSDVPLVVVEAPAGCGKTHQAADYARDTAQNDACGRVLILTHTHAACSEFSQRTKGQSSRVEIRTIDSLVANIASAYHAGIDLPADVTTWARHNRHGYQRVAIQVARLLDRHPMVAASIAARYPTVICDEHQDSSGDQNAIVTALLENGARLRIFADPMQSIFRDDIVEDAKPPWLWDDLVTRGDLFETLDIPHRWTAGCPQLGQWTLQARNALKMDGAIDLRRALPPSVTIVFAENEAKRTLQYQLSRQARRPIDAFERDAHSLLVLTRHNDTSESFRGFFSRRIPLWEGHRRPALEGLVDCMIDSRGDPTALAEAVARFLGTVAIGLGESSFGGRFKQEVQERCVRNCRGKPALIQELARCLVDEPNHRGVARSLRRLKELSTAEAAFANVAVDHSAAYWEAVRLGDFDTPDGGLAEITHRRTYSRPRPQAKAISTVHKAKGLQVGGVILMPCDANTFPDKADARCLLYVALSRATRRLLLVISRENPSPLFAF